MRRLRNIALTLLSVWVIFVASIFWLMHRPPIEFAAAIGRMPGPLFLVLPFETLWFQARAGSLIPGTEAPDFRLPTLDKKSQVALASFRRAGHSMKTISSSAARKRVEVDAWTGCLARGAAAGESGCQCTQKTRIYNSGGGLAAARLAALG